MLVDRTLQNGVDRCDASPRRDEPLPRPRLNPAPAAPGSLRTRSHRAMATAFTVYIDVPDEMQAQSCFQCVFDEIDRVEQAFSRFRASSEISRINRHAAAGPMVTDPETFRLLAAAVDLSRRTEGVFDITVGRLTRAWGFSLRQPKVPDAQTLAAAEQCSGWPHLELDPEWRTVHFLRHGLELDLGAIAKGYAVDCALEVLRSFTVQGLIDAGSSSIAATDEAFARGWDVSIANPLDASAPLGEVQLGQRALGTSGVREQSFVHDGRIHSHLVDPTAHGLPSGVPLRQVLQATVLAPTSMLADALSTAAFLLGPERGAAALEQFPGCSALWVCSRGNQIECMAHQWPGYKSSPWKESNNG